LKFLRIYEIGGIKYNQIHHYLIDWFEKNPPFLKHVGYSFNPFWGPLMQRYFFGKSDWFLMVDFLYLIPPIGAKKKFGISD
jgi:hypothetical protein